MNTSEKLSSSILIYAYAVFLGAAYLFAFWRPFGFSIFPYLALQDYISTPLNRVIVLITFPLLPFPLILQRLRLDAEIVITLFIALIGGYSGLALIYLSDGVNLFLRHSFQYDNETSVLYLIAFFTLSSWSIAILASRTSYASQGFIVALALIQSSVILAAGYKDGKTIFNGAVEVHFLDNQEVCEKEAGQPWVFLGRFSDSSIFMNAIDKRLCITAEKNYRLVPRKVIENL